MKKTTGILAITLLTMGTLTGCGMSTTAVSMSSTSVESVVAYKMEEERTKDVKIEKESEDDRNYIFIGDSYGSGHTEFDGVLTSWTTYVPNYLGLEEDDYYAMATPGAGFANKNYYGVDFLYELEYVTENVIHEEDRENITDIVVLGGYNDQAYSVEEIETAIDEFCDYAKENYPNATVRVGAVGWSTTEENNDLILENSIPGYKKVINHGGSYLYNTEFLGRCQDNFSRDGIHPNQNGQIQISRGVAEALMEGSCHIPENTK